EWRTPTKYSVSLSIPGSRRAPRKGTFHFCATQNALWDSSSVFRSTFVPLDPTLDASTMKPRVDRLLLALAIMVAGPAHGAETEHDLVIRHGKIVDGT